MKYLINPAFNDQNIIEFLNNIDCYMEESITFYKNRKGDTTTVALAEHQGKRYVIKRYNFRSIWHACKLQFRKSHGYKSFRYAGILSKLGIPCVKPIAFYQKKYFFLKGKSYFVSEHLEGVSGCHYFRNEAAAKNNWAVTIEAIFNIINQLKERRIYHGDFHFGNFIIVNEQPFLVDFDRIALINTEKKFFKKHQKDLKNFSRYLSRHQEACRHFKHHPNNIYF